MLSCTVPTRRVPQLLCRLRALIDLRCLDIQVVAAALPIIVYLPLLPPLLLLRPQLVLPIVAVDAISRWLYRAHANLVDILVHELRFMHIGAIILCIDMIFVVVL